MKFFKSSKEIETKQSNTITETENKINSHKEIEKPKIQTKYNENPSMINPPNNPMISTIPMKNENVQEFHDYSQPYSQNSQGYRSIPVGNAIVLSSNSPNPSQKVYYDEHFPPSGPYLTTFQCVNCPYQGGSYVRKNLRPSAWFISFLLCLSGCLLCALIPFFMDECYDYEYSCPNCLEIVPIGRLNENEGPKKVADLNYA